jgi:hypothetical protein
MRQCDSNIAMYTCLMLQYWTLLFPINYLNKLDNSNFFSADELRACEQLKAFFAKGTVYALEMGNRPQTLYRNCRFTRRPSRLDTRPRLA